MPAFAGYRIFVSIPPQKFLVERIVRTLGEVQVFMEPGQAPETWEPKPSRLMQLGNADLYLAIGVPFERTLLDRIRSQFPQVRVVQCCDDLLPDRGTAGTENTDPHIWTNPRLFLQYAELVHDTMLQLDVANRKTYSANYRRLSSELFMLHRDMRYLLRDRDFDEFIIDHGALAMLAGEYGLRQIALEQGGREIGARSLTGVIDLARSRNIRTDFTQKQHRLAAAEILARELGAGIAVIDLYEEDYLGNMRRITRRLGEALR